MAKRVISTQMQEEDIKIETSLRPQTLEDYIGQEKIKDSMKVYIDAAKARSFGPCSVLWTARTWKNNACRNYSQRNGIASESDFRTCNCQTG